MKPKLAKIRLMTLPGGRQSIILDFDNDRHHSMLIAGDRNDVANALHSLAVGLMQDNKLQMTSKKGP